MSDLDQLIDELFPKRSTNGLHLVPSKHSVKQEPPASHEDWDASDEDRADDDSNKTKVRPVVHLPVVITPKDETKHSSYKNYFDDSDENESETSGAIVKSFFTVPFPFLPSNIGGACVGKCFVTNMGAKGLCHPDISQLLLVSEGRYDGRLNKEQMLERKGAFYAINPKFGNGASDKYIHEVCNAGGCPLIMCCKCNYAVIRLQGAAWEDMGGVIDLYLTIRNYYPDWSRLASSRPVGQPKGGDYVRVLRSSLGCAAYCCQCSWLTVKSSHEIIETRLTDLALFMGKENSLCFATQVPLPPGEKRRLPLWVCKGHIPQF